MASAKSATMAWQDEVYTYVREAQKHAIVFQDGLQRGDPTHIGILVAIIVVFFSIAILVVYGGTNKRTGILLLGICDSGKTALFSRLVYGKMMLSYTSGIVNSGVYLSQKKKKSLLMLDLPGYERQRIQNLDKHKAQARGIVFVIDSLNFQREIRDVAEYLYTVLTDATLAKLSPPVLVLCNKQDELMAKGSKLIQNQLEKELTTTRNTKSRALEGTTATRSNSTFLGKKNKEFQFSDLRNFSIQFAECTVVP